MNSSQYTLLHIIHICILYLFPRILSIIHFISLYSFIQKFSLKPYILLLIKFAISITLVNFGFNVWVQQEKSVGWVRERYKWKINFCSVEVNKYWQAGIRLQRHNFQSCRLLGLEMGEICRILCTYLAWSTEQTTLQRVHFVIAVVCDL